MKFTTKYAACWFVIFSITLSGWVLADDAQLENIIVTNTRDDLILYLNTANAFNEELTTTIQAGIEVTFTYFIRLRQHRSFWRNKEISEQNITHTILYDTLKEEYVVTRSWEKKPHTVKTFKAASKLMTTMNGLVVTPLARLSKGEQYRIQVMAEQKKQPMPLKMHYVLFFLSLRDFETDWYTIDFTY